MSSPKISIIIPAFNQSAYLSEAIKSVLQQSYSEWELIVVDDGSTDETPLVVAQHPDPRIRYIRQANRGLPAARNTGIEASRGDYLAFLDADDYFHPGKLEVQVSHLEQNPEVGLSYASRIEVDGKGDYSWLLRAPETITLEDLVLGFPFTINDLLVRKSWVEKSGPFDESFRLHSEDRDFYLRLVLDGCRFERVNQFVAYRRLHARRVFSNISDRIKTMHRALDTAFDDPRLPAHVLALREKAYAAVFLTWSFQEFFQGEIASAQQHLRQAILHNPSILEHEARSLLNNIVWFSVRDGEDHLELVSAIFANLPPEYKFLTRKQGWVTGQGYLIRGGRAVLWGRLNEGRVHFAQAQECEVQLDRYYLQIMLDQLSSLELMFGVKRAQQALKDLAPFLKKVGTKTDVRWLSSIFSTNLAFNYYRQGLYARVPPSVLRAIYWDPSRLSDRGMIGLLARSLTNIVR